jgi:integrase
MELSTMAVRQLNTLTPRQVTAAVAKGDGKLSDGGGLYLRVTNGMGRWVYTFTRNGKSTSMGLGSADAVTLAHAREERRRLAEKVASGVNPLAERRRTQAEEAAKRTFAEVAAFVIERERKAWGASSLADWERSLHRHAKRLADLNVDAITVDHVKQVVTPILDRGQYDTARRTLSRIESVLDCAIAHGWRQTTNVAAWSVQKHIVPKRSKEDADRHHPAIDWRDAPAAIAELRASDTMSACCIELVALTGVRLSEARAARWDEFDFDKALWTVPKGRMKMREAFVVPLPRQALALLKGLWDTRTGPLVFPGRGKGPITRHATWTQCLRATGKLGSPHGFRSTMRTWMADHGVPREVAEQCLAHKLVGVEAAYNRAKLVELRRPWMQSWADHCDGKSADNVIAFEKRA